MSTPNIPASALTTHIYPPYNPSTVKIEPVVVPKPVPANALLVESHASTLTTGELGWFTGMSYPISPGYEVAGIVIALGEGVTRFKVGDEILALINQNGGGLSEVVVVEEYAGRLLNCW